MWLCDIVAFCQKMVVLAGVIGQIGWCGGKLRVCGSLRILLAKWVGGASVKAWATIGGLITSQFNMEVCRRS